MQNKLLGLDYRVNRAIDSLCTLISYLEENKNKFDPIEVDHIIKILVNAVETIYKGL